MEVLVYRRKETIVKENLDWESDAEYVSGKQTVKRNKAVLSPVFKQNKIAWNERADLGIKLDEKEKDIKLVDRNLKLFLMVSVLIFPYIIGFLVCYFIFYFYSGMTIDSFFIIQRKYHPVELWTIGIYLFVLVGVTWIVLKSLFQKER